VNAARVPNKQSIVEWSGSHCLLDAAARIGGMNIPLPAGEYLDKANQMVHMKPIMVWLVVRTRSSCLFSAETKIDTPIVPRRPVQRG